MFFINSAIIFEVNVVAERFFCSSQVSIAINSYCPTAVPAPWFLNFTAQASGDGRRRPLVTLGKEHKSEYNETGVNFVTATCSGD